ncbi:MAG: DUF1810 domain-containing protein [Steroidobacteraceae bacterium]
MARFIEAQEPVYRHVHAELGAGRKTSHWMWFIFPQLAGLGSSATARHYAIGSPGEARAYLAHPLLGGRLRECTQLVLQVEGRTPAAIFGYPDDLKFRSSMTLFARVADDTRPKDRVFAEALGRYFAGAPDPLTVRLLEQAGDP